MTVKVGVRAFIGGIAVQRWSQARVTRDVNLTLLTGFGKAPFIQALLAHYQPRHPDSAQFALCRESSS